MATEPLPKGKFKLILADPPWKFVTFNGKKSVPSRTDEDPYSTMTFDELAAMPVADVADKDCVLIMWVIDSHLKQGIALGEAWGFTFKTRGFTWDKERMGMGYWTRKQTEICLLFTRGKPPRKGAGVRDLIRAPRREHSRKPDEQFEAIETLTFGPYLELFGRQSRPGWTVWGNQATKFDASLPTDISARLMNVDLIPATDEMPQIIEHNHAVIQVDVAALLGLDVIAVNDDTTKIDVAALL